jgi:hypothetical protein
MTPPEAGEPGQRQCGLAPGVSDRTRTSHVRPGREYGWQKRAMMRTERTQPNPAWWAISAERTVSTSRRSADNAELSNTDGGICGWNSHKILNSSEYQSVRIDADTTGGGRV